MTGTELKARVLCDAVEMACRAPSLYNSQPWRWVAEGSSTLHLYADIGRALTNIDPLGREVYLSCGAALDHLVVALSASGWEAEVQRFPNPDVPLHLATIRVRPVAGEVSPWACARAEAILARRTDLNHFRAPAAWPDLEVTLRQTVIPYHVMFDTVLTVDRPQLAEMSRLTAEIRHNDHTFGSELAWWSPDGDRSEVVVLSTYHEDSHHDLLRCGEALSAVLLECTLAGHASCTLSHMTELAQPRELLRALIGQRGTPQLLIRVGRAGAEVDGASMSSSSWPVTLSPRKPLSHVMEFRPEGHPPP